jgi:hypothetical protein
VIFQDFDQQKRNDSELNWSVSRVLEETIPLRCSTWKAGALSRTTHFVAC